MYAKSSKEKALYIDNMITPYLDALSDENRNLWISLVYDYYNNNELFSEESFIKALDEDKRAYYFKLLDILRTNPDKYDEEDFIEDFYEEGSAYTLDGTYSLPFLKSTEIMFYNMDLLVEVMKDYKPEFNTSKAKIKEYMARISWDDFMDLCTQIRGNMAKYSNMLEVPMWYDSDANYIITKMFQNDVAYTSIDDAGKGKIEFASGNNLNKVVDLLDAARSNYAAGLFTTKGIKNTYGSDFFTNEKCIFSIGSSGGSGYNFPQADAFELGVCRVPASNNKPIYVSQGPTLAMFNDRGLDKEVNDKAQLYAWKFIKYICNILT